MSRLSYRSYWSLMDWKIDVAINMSRLMALSEGIAAASQDAQKRVPPWATAFVPVIFGS